MHSLRSAWVKSSGRKKVGSGWWFQCGEMEAWLRLSPWYFLRFTVVYMCCVCFISFWLWRMFGPSRFNRQDTTRFDTKPFSPWNVHAIGILLIVSRTQLVAKLHRSQFFSCNKWYSPQNTQKMFMTCSLNSVDYINHNALVYFTF